MSYSPREPIKALFRRLVQTAHDPQQSMIYNDFGTEFRAGYFPASFNHRRLLGNIALGLWREYPDTPRFLASYNRPGTGRNHLTLYFATLAETQNVVKTIDDAVRQECVLTGEDPRTVRHSVRPSRHGLYSSLVRRPATTDPGYDGA